MMLFAAQLVFVSFALGATKLPPQPISDSHYSISGTMQPQNSSSGSQVQSGLRNSSDRTNIAPQAIDSEAMQYISRASVESGIQGTKSSFQRQYNQNIVISSSLHRIPPSELETGLRSEFLADGEVPQIASAENGNLYVSVSTNNYDYTTYKMVYIYVSTDNGNSWSVAGGAYNTTSDLLDPDIEVINDRYVVIYANDINGDGNLQLQYYWDKFDGTEYQFGEIGPVTSDESVWWGSITSDKFYYDIQFTWLYVTYAISVWNGSDYVNNVYYSHSEDYGNSWSTPVQVSNNNLGAFRPGIAIAYGTPEPSTGVDFVYTTWRDEQYNGHIAKINIYDDTDVSTEMILPSSEGNSGWGHYAPSVATHYGDVIATSSVWWGSENSTNGNPDIAMTFSSDNGLTWGGNSSWYYWIDTDDLLEDIPTPSFDQTGVLGFTWKKGNEILFRTNQASSWLQGWNESIVIGTNVINSRMTGAAINNGTFHAVYDDVDNFGVYYDQNELGDLSAGTLSGTITNAVNGTPLQNVLVTIAGLSAYTNSSGSYLIENVPPGSIQASFSATPASGVAPLSVQFIDQSTTGTQAVTATSEGYIDYVNSNVGIYDNQTTVLNISLSPELAGADVRFVLNWNQTPSDLDVHLVTPVIGGESHHVYWNNLGNSNAAPYAQLDYDVTTGYGPETLTIYDLYSGVYYFYVYNYSQSPDLSASNGAVQIYGSGGYITTISVPTDQTGLYWNVCTVDGASGEITIINTLEGTPPGNSPPVDFDILKSSTRDVSWSWDFGDGYGSTQQNPTHIYTTGGVYDVTLAISDGGNYSTYTRSNYISVTGEVMPTLEITSPTFGSNYQILSTMQILWESENAGSSIRVEASFNGGSSWEVLAANAPNNGAYNWQIPGDWVDIGSGLIKITDTANPSLTSTSGGFSVTPTAEPQILSVVDTPNDDGYFIDIIFTRSFYDGGTGGAEIYSVWRLMDDGNWQSTNSQDASAQSLNYSLGTTFVLDEPTTFKIIATMDEGSFTSSTFAGISNDNNPPSVPTNLLAVHEGNNISISWDTNIENDFAYYQVFRGSSEDSTMLQLQYETTSNEYSEPFNSSYYYAVKAVDHSGNESGYSALVHLSAVGIDDLSGIPTDFELYDAYPNPFNPTTTIRYDLPKNGFVRLTIYNQLGQPVRFLVNREESAGHKSIFWDARDQSGRQVSTGIYFYRIEVNGLSQTRKMVMLK